MVIQFYSLQYTMYHAENAQAYQNLFLSQDRAVAESSSFRSQDIARAQALDQVQTLEEAGPKRIREEEGRRQPFGEEKEGEGDESRREEKPREEQAQDRQDPQGRGKCIDIEA